MKKQLLDLIISRNAKVGIIGMGYVGQALAAGTTSAGFETTGVDIDIKRVNSINRKRFKSLKATAKIDQIKKCDIICVCVPTPVDEFNKPNLKILENVLVNISKHLHPGCLVIIESSVAPGTTKNFALPILLKSNLNLGEDFFLGYSPERIDPGNLDYSINNTPKIVSGIDDISLDLTLQFYQTFTTQVIPVSSPQAAELTKVLENTFRLVNISLINEVAAFAQASGIDIWEVIEAASTKPYGFLAHYPGPGAGGDCIPVLPYHLLEAAQKINLPLKVVEAATVVNEDQPQKVARKALEVMNGKTKNGSPKVLLVGVSYKPESADIRHSPALKIWGELEKSGITVSFHDPYVKNINGSTSQKLTTNNISSCDLVIVTTPHKKISFAKLLKNGTPVIDTTNTFKGISHPNIMRIH